MAKKREFNVETITIDAQPAVNAIKKLDGTLGSLRSTIKGVKQDRQDALLAGDMEMYGKLTKKLEDLGAQYKNLRTLQRNIVTEVKNINDVLANMSNATYNELIQLQGQLQRAIKSAKPNTDDYKNLENTLRDVNARVEELKSTWKGLSEEAQKAAEAQRQAVVNEPLKHSVDQIKEAIKQTERLRDTKPVDSASYKQYNNELNKLKETLKEAEQPIKKTVLSSEELKKIINNLPTAPFEKLKLASEALEEELHKLAPDTEEFIVKSSELRIVNGQIAEINDKWKEHDGAILSTIKRLTAYVAVYGSFNFILGKLKGWTSDMLNLSDSMADVQKTTGIAGRQLVQLSKDIDHVDTRSTQEQMHNLAAVAGQIGLKSREDILGFVKASDQLTVALNELGDEGVQSLAKLATLTGDVQRMGIEKSMLAIGSSINELSANSAASAGPISDFMRRVGGLANMANLSSADLAALGATLDALGQPSEVAATAMNKFITTLVTNTEDVAYALDLDLKMIQDLIESGDTMKAITKVLESVRAKGNEGALAGIFKELGSEGARMQQVMMALAENTKLMRQQVEISRDAFNEATSATEEYNVKNETAAAVVERIGNTLREFFVSADYTQGLTNLLNKVHDFIKLMISASDEAVVFRAVLGSILVMKFTWNPAKQFAMWALELQKTTAAAVGLRKAWVALRALFTSTNVVAFAITAIAGSAALLINAFSGWGKEAKRLAEALDDLRQQEEGEKKHLEELYIAMMDVNLSQEKRNELIQSFNDKYSSYLGYVIDEAAGVDELTRAYELLNAQLELRYAKMLSTEYMKAPLEEYGREVRKINTKLLADLQDFGTKSGVHPKVLLESIADAARQFAEEGKRLSSATGTSGQEFIELMRRVKELSVTDNALLEKLVRTNMGNIQDLIQAERDLVIERYIAENEEGILVETAQNRVDKARKAMMNGLREEVAAYADNTDAIKQMKDQEVEAIIDKGNTVLNYLKEMGDKEAETFASQLDKIREIYAGDAWGKALNIQKLREAYGNLQNIKTASVDNLVETYKSLEDAGKRYTNVTEFNSLFGMNAKTIDEMHTFFKNYASQVKDRLKELGYTTAGNFDWSGEKGGKKKEEMKREFEAAKSLLLAYYEQRATIIKQAYLDEEITMAEKNRRITANEQEKSRALVDFYNILLGENKKYGIEVEKILEGKDLQKLAQFLTKLGPAMVDGMKLGREQSEGAIRDEAIKMREIIEKALLEGDMFGKLEDDFRSMLDELGLFMRDLGNGVLVGIDEAMAKGLINQLESVADKAYTVNEEGLRELLSQNIEYGEWWGSVEDEYMTLVLQKLRGYYDNRLEMQRKYAQRMQREWQQQYKQSGGLDAYEANKRMIEEAGSAPEGYVKGAGDYNEERGIIKAKAMLEGSRLEDEIASYQERLKTLTEGSAEYEAMQALIAQRTTELNAIIQQSEIDTTNVTLEQWQKRAEALGEWAEMVGETMGEVYMLERQANNARARGDEETAKKLEAQAKESRQNLVKEALNKAIDMAKVWAMELGFKVMYNALAKKSDEDVAASGAKATMKGVFAEIIAQGFKGAGKEIGSKGMAGLITGGVIIAAAAGLAAAAKAAVANMYPEAVEGVSDGSTSTKRKLTTGMLTYAEGRYPVLGNDGVVYDAQYAGANMKTGVYRKPHFGIFAEKQPEMVIDGKTTQRLVLNYPEVYNGILQLSRTGRMGMRTYNDGNVPEFAAVSAQQQIQMEEMRMTMAATAAALAALTKRLDKPINATVNRYGRGGSLEAERKAQRWESKNRV